MHKNRITAAIVRGCSRLTNYPLLGHRFANLFPVLKHGPQTNRAGLGFLIFKIIKKVLIREAVILGVEKYQDYVIKDGKFVGQFEEMYEKFDDPWMQTVKEPNAREKAVILEWCKKLGRLRIMEIGCGLGVFTRQIHDAGFDVLGIDISATAIKKARLRNPGVNFKTGDILDFQAYHDFRPEVIIMSEISWYVLEKIVPFLTFLKSEFPHVILMHTLTTYPEGEQKYGKEYFTNQKEINKFFGLSYMDSGEVAIGGGIVKTWFVGKFSS